MGRRSLLGMGIAWMGWMRRMAFCGFKLLEVLAVYCMDGVLGGGSGAVMMV